MVPKCLDGLWFSFRNCLGMVLKCLDGLCMGLVLEHSLNGCGEEQHPDSDESLLIRSASGLAP